MTLPVPERMGLCMSDAAVSVTITSVTDIVSFFIGIYSPFRSVQLFCIYSGTIFNTKIHISFNPFFRFRSSVHFRLAYNVFLRLYGNIRLLREAKSPRSALH